MGLAILAFCLHGLCAPPAQTVDFTLDGWEDIDTWLWTDQRSSSCTWHIRPAPAVSNVIRHDFHAKLLTSIDQI